MYYNARYYDRAIGHFISPDTLVPDPTSVWDYNRFLYVRGNPLKYSDPTGHCVFGLDTIVCVVVAAAAVVGGTANAAGNAGSQIYQNWDSDRAMLDNFTDVNTTEVGIAFGFGAIAGGAAPVTGGATALLIGAATGAAQEVTTDMVIGGRSFTEAVDPETAIAAGLGVVGSAIQGAMPKQLIYTFKNGDELGVATARDALANGGEFFMNNTNRELTQQQLGYVASGRFVTGAGVGNIPVSSPNTQAECGFWACPLQTIQRWWNGEDDYQ